jgi:hypothetical protein
MIPGSRSAACTHRRRVPIDSLFLIAFQNESAIENAETRIVELKAAKDFGAELSWSQDLRELFVRRSALQLERENEVTACMAAEAKKIADQAEYGTEHLLHRMFLNPIAVSSQPIIHWINR